jgi:hypothetical protein
MLEEMRKEMDKMRKEEAKKYKMAKGEDAHVLRQEIRNEVEKIRAEEEERYKMVPEAMMRHEMLEKMREDVPEVMRQEFLREMKKDIDKMRVELAATYNMMRWSCTGAPIRTRGYF